MSTINTVAAPETFPDRLKVLGKEVGSLKKLSILTEVSYPNILRYVQGTEPKREALAKITSKLDINGTWLLTGEGPRRGSASTDRTNSTADTVELAKFSPKIYQTAVEEAVDFQTRGMRMQMLYTSFYQTEKMHVDRATVIKLFGCEDPEIVVYEYFDSRTTSSPVLAYIDLFDTSFREGQKALAMIKGNLYILKAKGANLHEETLFHDISTVDPVKPISFAQLNRVEALIGKIVYATYRE